MSIPIFRQFIIEPVSKKNIKINVKRLGLKRRHFHWKINSIPSTGVKTEAERMRINGFVLLERFATDFDACEHIFLFPVEADDIFCIFKSFITFLF